MHERVGDSTFKLLSLTQFGYPVRVAKSPRQQLERSDVRLRNDHTAYISVDRESLAQNLQQIIQLVTASLTQWEDWQPRVTNFQAGSTQAGFDGRGQTAFQDEVQ